LERVEAPYDVEINWLQMKDYLHFVRTERQAYAQAGGPHYRQHSQQASAPFGCCSTKTSRPKSYMKERAL